MGPGLYDALQLIGLGLSGQFREALFLDRASKIINGSSEGQKLDLPLNEIAIEPGIERPP